MDGVLVTDIQTDRDPFYQMSVRSLTMIRKSQLGKKYCTLLNTVCCPSVLITFTIMYYQYICPNNISQDYVFIPGIGWMASNINV